MFRVQYVIFIWCKFFYYKSLELFPIDFFFSFIIFKLLHVLGLNKILLLTLILTQVSSCVMQQIAIIL